MLNKDIRNEVGLHREFHPASRSSLSTAAERPTATNALRRPLKAQQPAHPLINIRNRHLRATIKQRDTSDGAEEANVLLLGETPSIVDTDDIIILGYYQITGVREVQ